MNPQIKGEMRIVNKKQNKGVVHLPHGWTTIGSRVRVPLEAKDCTNCSTLISKY